MKIVEVNTLAIPDLKIIRFTRFCDHRGYFTEHYRKSDFQNHGLMEFMKDVEFVQCNESFSRKGTVRGLHFQWNPYMGKLVHTLRGRMIDMALDIRKNSPTFGNIVLYDMPYDSNDEYGEWIWIPPGFAHGNMYPEDSMIEYFCTGQYSQDCEAGISPLAKDINWDLCDPELKRIFDEIAPSTELITEKDRHGFTIEDWGNCKDSENFKY